MSDVTEIIKKTGRKSHSKISFNHRLFIKIFGMWIIGGLMASIPIGFDFARSPVEYLTLMRFFGNYEIIYICVTMGIIVLVEVIRKKAGILFLLNFLLIIMGIIIYMYLRDNGTIPILNYGYGLSIFNKIFLAFILIIGCAGYLSTCFERRWQGR